MAFGRTLKNILTEKGVTQSELAKALGMSETTLSGMIKRDIDRVSIDIFLKICDYLNCNPQTFYEEYRVKENELELAEDKLTDEEQKLLDFFRLLNAEGQLAVLKHAEYCSQQSEYKKGYKVYKIS